VNSGNRSKIDNYLRELDVATEALLIGQKEMKIE
jgi:hypothetical protein